MTGLGNALLGACEIDWALEALQKQWPPNCWQTAGVSAWGNCNAYHALLSFEATETRVHERL